MGSFSCDIKEAMEKALALDDMAKLALACSVESMLTLAHRALSLYRLSG